MEPGRPVQCCLATVVLLACVWAAYWTWRDGGGSHVIVWTDAGGAGGKASWRDSVSAHASDPLRLDVVVPGEQHFYLRAPSPQERQQWLVALGSVKSCLNSEQGSQLLRGEDEMRRKFCELRLYCDLLTQQVYSIKSAIIDNPIPNVQKLDESASLLGETCEIFIRTVGECMRMASPPSPVGYPCSVSMVSGLLKDPVKKSRASNSESDLERNRAGAAPTPLHHSSVPSKETKPTQPEESTSFFASVETSFAEIRLNDDGSVPTVPFLDACTSLTKIFDMMGSTAYAPVKMDVTGNIRKLTLKYESGTEKFPSLQAIVGSEIEKGTQEQANSATDALLWLKRGVGFLREFLNCFQQGDLDLADCANKAYSSTLKKHHGWIIRGMFSLAAKAAPSREDFMRSLTGSDGPSPRLHSEITAYLAGIDRCLKSLNQLYRKHRLDSDLDDDS